MQLSREYTRVEAGRRLAIAQYIYDDAMEKFDVDLPFDNLFGEGVTRVVLPFQNKGKEQLSQELGKTGPLGDKGYDYIDWSTGEAVKVIPPHPKAPPGTKEKERRVAIGKVITSLPVPEERDEWLKWWSENQEIVKRDDYSLVISRHPVDVIRMSDHRNMSSCHSPDEMHWDSCVGEVKHGGLVAYLVNAKDIAAIQESSPEAISGQGEIFLDEDREIPGIEPLSRLRVRRFTHKDGDFDLAIPEDRLYGRLKNPEFRTQVVDWARKSQETLLGGKRLRMKDFIRRGGAYQDTEDGALFNQFFGDELERESANTTFGFPGEEEGSQEARNEELRNEMEEINNRWDRLLKHCNLTYEEYDDGRDEDISFYWSASTGVSISDSFIRADALEEIEPQLNRGYGRNKKENTLKEALDDEGFYIGDGTEISFYHSNNTLNFYFDISDEDRQGSGPEEYNDFCRGVSDDWDDKHDEIKNVVIKWLMDNEFANPSPVRAFEDTDTQFQNFEVEMSPGEMEAKAEASIGVYDPATWDRDLFKSHVDAQIRAIVSQELIRIIYNRKHPAAYLPGFEPDTPVTIKEDYNLSNFRLTLRSKGYPPNSQILLGVAFEADDVTSAEDMAEIVELMKVVDRLFPRILNEGARLLESYYDQIRAFQQRAEGMETLPPASEFQFDPNR